MPNNTLAADGKSMPSSEAIRAAFHCMHHVGDLLLGAVASLEKPDHDPYTVLGILEVAHQVFGESIEVLDYLRPAAT